MNKIEKVVFSRTLKSADWNSTKLFNGNVAEEVSKLKTRDGGDIFVFGSADLTATLMEHGLIDEYTSGSTPSFSGRHAALQGRPEPDTPEASGDADLSQVLSSSITRRRADNDDRSRGSADFARFAAARYQSARRLHRVQPLAFEILTPDEMANADRPDDRSGLVDGIGLMRRAGQAVAAVILERFPEAAGVAVLAGPGNNGGDGYVDRRGTAPGRRRRHAVARRARREPGTDAAIAAAECTRASRGRLPIFAPASGLAGRRCAVRRRARARAGRRLRRGDRQA